MEGLTASLLRRGFRNNCGRPPKAELEQRVAFQEAAARKRAVMLLFVGAVSGFLGFAFAGFAGLMEFAKGPLQLNFRGEPMPSGQNYYAQTVSELVGNPASPAGKSFFSFCLVGAVCMLVSFYPYHLRNVYVGDDQLICGVSWLALRTFLPPIGLMLTVLAPAKALQQSSTTDFVALAVHCIGASMMLSGHCIFEFQALVFSRVVQMSSLERKCRWLCLLGCVLSGAIFVSAGGLAGAASAGKVPICCMDEWQVPSLADVAVAKELGHPGVAVQAMLAYDSKTPMLLNTAHGPALLLKIVEYWFEVFMGFFMIFGLLCIWSFSHERVLDLQEIPDVNPELEMQ